MTIDVWEGKECCYCEKKVDYCCDNCGDLVCEGHVVDWGGYYFCSNSCGNQFDKLMNRHS